MGAKLKPTEQKEPDARGGLLGAIQAGKKLKKVEVVENDDSQEELSGVAGALKNALAARFAKVQDSGSEGESDGEGWSDDDDEDC